MGSISALGSSAISKQYKYKENHSQAYHSQTTEKQRQSEFKQRDKEWKGSVS